ncbi:hypothetical protein K1719_006836 [Acacia pycnantha]|nr:hypothetical protein K1719_006836 [Acacia pycnantha]
MELLFIISLLAFLIRNADSGLPKSVKLKCSLCDSVFSTSNPSRTAWEHLKRGTWPNLRPNSSISPMSISTVALPNSNNHDKKRSSPHMAFTSPHQNHSKIYARPLAMFEDIVKRFKSPKTSPSPALSREQINSAIELLADDWFYESSCGSVFINSSVLSSVCLID